MKIINLIFVLSISAFFILKEASPGVSRYLLLILGANMAVYMTFYACMKYYYVIYEALYPLVVDTVLLKSVLSMAFIFLFFLLRGSSLRISAGSVSTLSSARECVAEFELVSSSESDSNYSSVSFEPVLSDDFASSFSISYFLL